MQVPLVMTIIGPDRPGLVELVARIVAEHDGNWLESRMSHLAGQFAGILRVQAPSENEQALVRTLKSLESQGLNITVHSGREAAAEPEGPVVTLHVVGQDRPGIIREISTALAAEHVNVEELNTECESAAMSGETIFKATARLRVPATCNLDELRQDLQKIAADLLVDVSFEKAG